MLQSCLSFVAFGWTIHNSCSDSGATLFCSRITDFAVNNSLFNPLKKQFYLFSTLSMKKTEPLVDSTFLLRWPFCYNMFQLIKKIFRTFKFQKGESYEQIHSPFCTILSAQSKYESECKILASESEQLARSLARNFRNSSSRSLARI